MDADLNSKKSSLEDLAKDELIKKYKGLLTILQKAKQSKETLIEENNNLKEKLKITESDTEMLEGLIQQKVQLVTSLEEIKSQKRVLENKLKDCEYDLSTATTKIVNLDNENQGCRRQIQRLVEENEQLLTRLDSLERETEELKDIGVKQQEQLLALTEHNNSSVELSDHQTLKTKFEQLEDIYSQSLCLNKELTLRNGELLEKCESLNQNIRSLEGSSETTNKFIIELKKTVEGKNLENDRLQHILSDLQVELNEKIILIEQLKEEASNLHVSKDSANTMSDLQDTNNKLKEKLKLFHSKLVKFANDVKLLRQEKNELLNSFKGYVYQVKLWEDQLKELSVKIINQCSEFERNKSKFTLEYDSLKIKYDGVEKENSTLNGHNKDLSNSIKVLKSKINNDQSEKLYSDNKILTEKLNNLIKQTEELRSEVEYLKSDRNLQEDQLIESQQLNNKVQKEKDSIEEENQLLQEENASLLNNFEQQANELASHLTVIETFKKNVCDYQNALTNMNEQVKKLNEENKNISEKLRDMEETLFQRENEFSFQQQQLKILKNENYELLAEMNEMNQVLKERGETISKQQEYCEELLKNVKLQESQTKKYLELSNEKDCVIKKLEESYDALKSSALYQVIVDNPTPDSVICMQEDEERVALQNEITALKERLSHLQDTSQEVCYAENETLSTSTISKVEDMNRIRDLDGSWEERYGKLRSLALKLKGKIRELSEHLTKEQNEKNELQQKFVICHKTIQTLQSQCDLLHDELDNNKVELLNCTKKLDLAASNQSTHLRSLADNDELINKLKLEIETLDKEKTNTDSWKKQVSSKVQNLRRELDANLLVKRELEDQIKKVNVDLEEKSRLLNDEIEKHNATKNSLLESHNECKKQSVLNLEIQDYERSMKEFAQKLDKKQETITKLKNQVDQQTSGIGSLKEQNRLLEERIQSDEKDLNNVRGELQTYKKRAVDLEATMIEKDEKLLHLTHSLETSRGDNEELSTHLSKVVSDNEKISSTLKSDKQLLHTQNSGLEMKIREMNDKLKLKEEELQNIGTEYESYKVRAQSVLRSSQVRDVGLEEKLAEEVTSLHAQVEVLTSEIVDLQTLSKNLNDENLKLILEKEGIGSKWKEIETTLEEQKQLYDILSTKHQKAIMDHSETISSLKVHADTLSQCYRQQLSDQEVRHNKEIIELQSKVDKVTPILDTPVHAPLLPREQGEGSEFADTPNNVKANHPLPLDKLLNSEMEQDVGFLRKQITEHETKVNYLTSLLADTEQDLVKHVQMNKVLKEEVRRYQRSEEREKHAENLEYLKNVVFKFATLNSGDERSRLVPVLNTILKFSPDESNQLNLVAKGEVPGRSWSDYLPIWSGGKPQ